jgi:hypothetical protein
MFILINQKNSSTPLFGTIIKLYYRLQVTMKKYYILIGVMIKIYHSLQVTMIIYYITTIIYNVLGIALFYRLRGRLWKYKKWC